MTMNVADTLVETAVRAGVQRVYGMIGDSLNPIGDAIRRNGKMRWIHVRHEEVAAFAAGAEAQLTGRAGMCAGSSGPGHLHLLNGLYDAHRSGAPVFALASVIASAEIGGSSSRRPTPIQCLTAAACTTRAARRVSRHHGCSRWRSSTRSAVRAWPWWSYRVTPRSRTRA